MIISFICSNLFSQDFGDSKSQVLIKLEKRNMRDWFEDYGSTLISLGPNGQTMSYDFKNNRLYGKGVTEPHPSLSSAREALRKYTNEYKSQGYEVFKNNMGDVSNGGITCKLTDSFQVIVIIQQINNKYHINHTSFYDPFK